MSYLILTKTYSEPPFCEKEILRYAGCRQTDHETSVLLSSCISEVRDKLTYKICYCELKVDIKDHICDFGAFKLQSKNLASNLSGCSSVILFGATIGVGIDRLISKYGRISPSKALMIQAIGAERIEALCDTFCKDIANEMHMNIKVRFSPGYGDLPLTAQKDIFKILDCPKRIGLLLNDSLIMTPSKSVTAFAGLFNGNENRTLSKCNTCDKTDCTFRGAL